MIGSTPNAIFATRRPHRELYDQSIWSMGTQVRLSVLRDDYAPNILEDAIEAIRIVDRNLSVHRFSSELSLVNSAPGVWHTGSRSLMEVSRAALRYGDLSEGALDVTVLPILRRLGFAPMPTGLGTGSEVVDYTKLRVNIDGVSVDSGGYAVDFGGVAKGFAVDEALASLRKANIRVALIDAGGDLFAMGRPDDGRRWKIGIRDPFHPDSLFATIEIEDEAVATSGTYAQSRLVDGVRRSHLIDPKTGLSVDHVVSATVLARSTMKADALATAISIMTPKASRDLISRLRDVEALWVFGDGSIAATEGLSSRIQIL